MCVCVRVRMQWALTVRLPPSLNALLTARTLSLKGHWQPPPVVLLPSYGHPVALKGFLAAPAAVENSPIYLRTLFPFSDAGPF